MTWLDWVVPILTAMVTSFVTMLRVRPRVVCGSCSAPRRYLRTIYVPPLGKSDAATVAIEMRTAHEFHRRAWHGEEEATR